MSAAERVAVSVVSGSDPGLVREFLRSLYATTPEGPAFVVAVTLNVPDVRLRDELLADAADAGWTTRVDVRTNEQRRGFAANHNRAIRDHSADYYLICNDDIVVLPGAVATLLAFMRDPAHARVGVASPMLLNEDRTVQGSTYSFPSPLRVLAAAADLRANRLFRSLIESRARAAAPGRSRLWAHDRTMTVDSVRGAFVLVRNEAIADVGLMDEIALVGGEELEWHRRMSDAGWTVAFVHEAEVVHLGGRTVTADPALRVEYVKGWLNYFQKHGRSVDVLALRAGLSLIFGARCLPGLSSSDTTSRRANREGLRVALRWPAIWREAARSGAISEA